MGFDRKKRRMAGFLAILLAGAFTTAALSACSKKNSGQEEEEPLSVSGFAFDTAYTITLYQGGGREILNHCISLCTEYENIFSASREESELYQVNEMSRLFGEAWQEVFPGEKPQALKKNGKGEGKRLGTLRRKLQEKLLRAGLGKSGVKINKSGALEIPVSGMLSDILDRGLYYSELSEGRFDITIQPVSGLWDFSSGKGKVPEKERIKEALGLVDYRMAGIRGDMLTLQMPGMGIDLGGIAKGYIADLLKEYLSENGVTSAIIDLGGNILCIGRKGEEDFRIGIRQPFADRDETVAVVGVCGKSVVSSGVYERYIRGENGKMYHHILNPQTGYSYENELIGVSIISGRSVDGDGISTTAFALGTEKGMELIDSLEDTEAVFITEDEQLHYSAGFQEMMETD